MSRRFALGLAVLSGLAAFVAAAPAYADEEGPVIVIPSRPGVPVVINGRDASYAVVEGDWGLARPGHGTVTVYGGSPIQPNAVYQQRSSYHPRYGRPPPRGRNEVDNGPEGPQSAETFSRNWSSSSSDVAPPPSERSTPAQQMNSSSSSDQSGVPATVTDPATFYQPEIVVAPSGRRRHH